MERAGQQIVCGASTTLRGYGIDERERGATAWVNVGEAKTDEPDMSMSMIWA